MPCLPGWRPGRLALQLPSARRRPLLLPPPPRSLPQLKQECRGCLLLPDPECAYQPVCGPVLLAECKRLPACMNGSTCNQPWWAASAAPRPHSVRPPQAFASGAYVAEGHRAALLDLLAASPKAAWPATVPFTFNFKQPHR